MNRLEFQKLTNVIVTDEQFEEINSMYMDADNMCKDEFCEEYLKYGDSKLLNFFYNRYIETLDAHKHLTIENVKNSKLILDKALKYNDKELYDMAVEVLGIKYVVMHKIENGKSLNGEEIEFVKLNLA